MKDGVIIINKEENITSQGVVNRVKRLLGTDKAGHTGTLDPMATGVLPVLVGRGVKASEYMLSSDKHYRAVLKLGFNTDTEDITGCVTERFEYIPTEDEVTMAVRSMQGVIMQTPPMYSAVKVGGKKLYELAREGKEIERAAREVTIHSISAEKLQDDEYIITVCCSKGTYIRTLCADIAKKLGTGGCMKSLCRLEACGFTLADAVTLKELESMTEEEKEKRIIPLEFIFSKLERVTLSDFFSRLAACGAEIYLRKLGISLEENKRVALFDKNGFFAVGEVRKFDTGLAIKPIKQFRI